MFFNGLSQRFLLRFRSKAIKSINRMNYSTIYSLSTNIKESGSPLAVIRVSGVKTLEALRQLIKKKSFKCESNPRKAVLSDIYDNKSNELLDKAIVIWFPKPFSYTGEDMTELHIHGSNAVITSVLTALSRIDGCRPAQNGEFTKRALINNKIGLIEAEAIHELITSRTDSQRRRALSAMSGNIANIYQNYRHLLIKLIAHLEANIDFGEEELIEDSVLDSIKSQLFHLRDKIETHLKNAKNKSDLIRDGLRVTIIGESNAGKSTLINQLCQLSVIHYFLFN